jgi:hypothetical protein
MSHWGDTVSWEGAAGGSTREPGDLPPADSHESLAEGEALIHMKTRIGTLAVLTAALALAPAAYAAPTKVKVRIEGATKTLFEGAVTTDAHPVDAGDGSGAHTCDGTNGGANSVPGPTATGALDDAVKLGSLSWTGSYSNSFSDFIVSKIGPDAATASKFWGVAVQWTPLQVGGCQFKVSPGEEVLWAYDLFSKKHVLKLSGPRRAHHGKLFTVKVVDGQTNKPVMPPPV